jgi:hypothetical protein
MVTAGPDAARVVSGNPNLTILASQLDDADKEEDHHDDDDHADDPDAAASAHPDLPSSDRRGR